MSGRGRATQDVQGESTPSVVAGMPPLTGVVDELAPPDRAPATPEAGEGARPAADAEPGPPLPARAGAGRRRSPARSPSRCASACSARATRSRPGRWHRCRWWWSSASSWACTTVTSSCCASRRSRRRRKLFQLATLVHAGAVDRRGARSSSAALGGGQVLALWIVAVPVPGRRAGGGARLRPAHARPPSAACCWATRRRASAPGRKIEASATVNAEVVAQITSVRIGETEVPLGMLAAAGRRPRDPARDHRAAQHRPRRRAEPGPGRQVDRPERQRAAAAAGDRRVVRGRGRHRGPARPGRGAVRADALLAPGQAQPGRGWLRRSACCSWRPCWS